MILLLVTSFAHAFCGAYAGSAEQDMPTNARSEAVLVRDGTSTTLTLAADVEGDATDFALLLPIPEVLTAEDVQLVDPNLVDLVSIYGTPRAVVYTCDDALSVSAPNLPIGCAGNIGCAAKEFSGMDGFGDTGANTVVIESAFTVGGYELVVLSAEQSGDLWSWLDQNGYAIPASGLPVLQEYIDQGVYFLAARISLDAAPDGAMLLNPLQLRYNADAFALPIRIGTISANGEQEVVLHVFNEESDGQAAIANYPEVRLDRDCMWPDDVSDFSDWYNGRLADNLGGDNGIAWTREHSWPVYSNIQNYHCDPCTATGDFTYEQLAALGTPNVWEEVHYTRLRLRYLPEDATEDLSLYFDGVTGVKDQSRFIEYAHALEFLFPICDLGWAEDPGECEVARTSADPRYTGCAAYKGPLGFAVALAALLIRRRRK